MNVQQAELETENEHRGEEDACGRRNEVPAGLGQTERKRLDKEDSDIYESETSISH